MPEETRIPDSRFVVWCSLRRHTDRANRSRTRFGGSMVRSVSSAQCRTISNAARFAQRIGGTRNAWRTDVAIPCANHVTWTRQYRMIRGEMALILLTFLRQSPKGQIGANFRAKKPANALALRAFILVAGIGFEPMTFRL